MTIAMAERNIKKECDESGIEDASIIGNEIVIK
jgi:hypothetical protein